MNAKKKQLFTFMVVVCMMIGVTALSSAAYSEKQSNACEITGHIAEIIESISPSCTQRGKTAGEKCELCGEIIVAPVDIPATGHKIIVDPAMVATCTSTGLTEGSHCDYCGEIFEKQTVIDRLAHNWCEWEEIIAPTCDMQGLERRTCVVCGTVEDRDIASFGGHEIVTLPGYPSTCSEPGLTNGIYCTKCNTIFKIREEIPSSGHCFEQTGERLEPTCTTEGREAGLKCIYCETYNTEIIPALGHDLSEQAIVKTSTCTEKGESIAYCSRCDYQETKEMKLEPHKFGKYISDGTVTCVTDGQKIAKCENCDATKSKVEKSGHKFSSDWTTDVEATCKANGVKSRHCKRCGEKTDIIILVAGSHAYTAATTIPTCTTNGYTTYVCTVCEDTYTDNEVAALGHNVDDNGICQTCGLEFAEECSCKCHSDNPIEKIIYKLIVFFWKILKTNDICECGVPHY